MERMKQKSFSPLYEPAEELASFDDDDDVVVFDAVVVVDENLHLAATSISEMNCNRLNEG
jgi:hypothetical protein